MAGRRGRSVMNNGIYGQRRQQQFMTAPNQFQMPQQRAQQQQQQQPDDGGLGKLMKAYMQSQRKPPTMGGVADAFGGSGGVANGQGLGMDLTSGVSTGAGPMTTIGGPAAALTGLYYGNRGLGAGEADSLKSALYPVADVATLGLHRSGGGPIGKLFDDTGWEKPFNAIGDFLGGLF